MRSCLPLVAITRVLQSPNRCAIVRRGFLDAISRTVNINGSQNNPKNSSNNNNSNNVPMKRHHERRLLRFPNTLLYEVVSDVANYSKFVPWCKASRVLQSSEHAMSAELEVGFQYLSEKYLSQVTLDQPRSVVATSSQTQLFEHLRSDWRFQPSSSEPTHATWVTFSVEFQFKSSLYNEVSELFMQEVVKKMVRAFEQRCRELHDQRTLKRK